MWNLSHGVVKSFFPKPQSQDTAAEYSNEGRQAGGFPGGASDKEFVCSAGDTRDVGLIPGSGRSPVIGNGNPPQYSCLENSMDRRAWQASVHGIPKCWAEHK